MGLPIPIPSATPLRALPTIRPNPFMSVPSGITQMVAPRPNILMQLPPRLPPLNLAPLARGFKALSFIGAATLIVDVIGQAGANKWRDNLLNQINGGNSSEVKGVPPFRGGQSAGVQYDVKVMMVFENKTLYTMGFQPQDSSEFVRGNIVPKLGAISSVSYRKDVFANVYPQINGADFGTFVTTLFWGNIQSISIVSIVRTDGQNDYGGDPYVEPIGEPAINPFLVPPIEPEGDRFVVPNPSNPTTIQNPLKKPSPSQKTSPSKNQPPLTNPFPNTSPSPLTNPFPNTSPQPNKNPFINPSNLPIPKPVNIQKSQVSITNVINNQITNNINAANQLKESEQTNEANRLRKNNECCKPEFVSISVREFLSCKSEGGANFRAKSVSVLKGTEESTYSLFESVAMAAAAQCKPDSDGAVAAVPEWWQIRPEAQRPQLVLQFCAKINGKFTSPKYVITLPHPKSNQKPLSPLIDEWEKGDFEGVLTLKDNSKLIVNCISQKEAERVIKVLSNFISTSMLDGARTKYSERLGKPITRQKVYARIATYFENGVKDATSPKWKAKFNLPSS